MRPRRLACLATGVAAVLFVVHGQFRPELKERKIYKVKTPPRAAVAPTTTAPAPVDTHSIPAATTVATAASIAAAPELGELGVEAYSGGSPYDCKPSRVPRGMRALDYIASPSASEWPINCGADDNQELCNVVRKTAVEREVITAVCNYNVVGQLEKWVDANRRSKITNMLIIAIDDRLPGWLESNGVAYWHKKQSAAGSHKISAQKFKFVRQFLSIGCSVLMSDIDVVYLQNPFLHLHKDADIEGTTDGWDDGSAYGWMEQLDDASMGAHGRFRPAMRITAWNSGLWYARATHASLRLMSILAYRMETEDTWDQAAFGEEVARPARDDHHAAGITKRALNHWCFANSKTLFRRMRVEEALREHTPVVVHANYHQPKEPRMRAVFDRWHLGQRDALDRFAAAEQAYTVPAPLLEMHFQHSINDGFVSGSNLRDASLAVGAGHGCAPRPSKHGVRVSLHALPGGDGAPCAPADDVCAAARRVARRGAHGPELVLVLAGRADAAALELFLQGAAAAGVSNLLLVCTDDALCDDARAALPSGGAKLTRRAAPGLEALRAKYAVLAAVLAAGVGVLSAHVATVMLSDPFAALYRDADIEAMSAGWDDGSAYGYNHVLDDPAMGFTRFCHGSRIVAYEPGLFYAAPTTEAAALALRMELQLGRHLPPDSPADVAAARERELFLSELWLPSHHNYTSVGAVLRVMNYLCFANSKVLFRHVRHSASATRPVLVHMSYHSDVVPRMRAVLQKYVGGDPAPLAALPLADTSAAAADVHSLKCDDASREGGAARLESEAGLRVVRESPWAWGGVTDLVFKADGELATPWGPGKWGGLPDAPQHVFADFVGSRHNLRVMPQGLAVSTRCSDSNVVLVRSMKGA